MIGPRTLDILFFSRYNNNYDVSRRRLFAYNTMSRRAAFTPKVPRGDIARYLYTPCISPHDIDDLFIYHNAK